MRPGTPERGARPSGLENRPGACGATPLLERAGADRAAAAPRKVPPENPGHERGREMRKNKNLEPPPPPPNGFKSLRAAAVAAAREAGGGASAHASPPPPLRPGQRVAPLPRRRARRRRPPPTASEAGLQLSLFSPPLPAPACARPRCHGDTSFFVCLFSSSPQYSPAPQPPGFPSFSLVALGRVPGRGLRDNQTRIWTLLLLSIPRKE